MQTIHIWAILLFVGVLALRQLAPDLAALWQKASPTLVGFFQKKPDSVLQQLKDELAALKQQQTKPAAP